MSAIAGILSSHRPVNPLAVQAMAGLMAHRGADGSGQWGAAAGRLVLTHRRPAAARSARPWTTAKRIVVVDGAIRNQSELRAELVSRGHVFATDDDAEVIAAAWTQWGEACVDFLNGAFAFALWDADANRLFCARDRFGEKPLLYAAGDGFFAFASEYRALLTLDGIAADIDQGRLARFLADPVHGLEQGGTTVFPAIGQVPPAHRLTVDGHSLERRQERYWHGKPARLNRRPTVAAAADALHDLLTDSLRRRLDGGGPVAACLSGGVGAGAILCLTRRELGGDVPIHAFSARFPTTSADEGAHMEAVAAAIRPLRHDVEPKPETLVAELGRFARDVELPAQTLGQYARYDLCRLARQLGVGVLLDGRGADQVLGGDERYFTAYLRGGGSDSPLLRSRYGDAAVPPRPWAAALPPRWRQGLARRLNRGSDMVFGLAGTVDAEPPPPPATLHEALRRDALDGRLTALLRRDDRAAMAHGVELCRPFADHRLFEFAQALPAEHLMGEGESKRLLRAALAGILPDMVRQRWRKHALAPPRLAWLHQALLPAVEQVVEDDGLSPVWERPWWRAAIRRFRAGDTALAEGLWKVLATEAWRVHFLGAIATRHKFQPLL